MAVTSHYGNCQYLEIPILLARIESQEPLDIPSCSVSSLNVNLWSFRTRIRNFTLLVDVDGRPENCPLSSQVLAFFKAKKKIKNIWCPYSKTCYFQRSKSFVICFPDFKTCPIQFRMNLARADWRTAALPTFGFFWLKQCKRCDWNPYEVFYLRHLSDENVIFDMSSSFFKENVTLAWYVTIRDGKR